MNEMTRREFVGLAGAAVGEYPSHPELKVAGTWSVGKIRKELARMRALGLTGKFATSLAAYAMI